MAGDFRFTRRDAVKAGAAGALAAVSSPGSGSSGSAAPVAPVAVKANWLGDEAPAAACAVTWGLPWRRGALAKGNGLTARSADGSVVPLQSWPLAYWPDGSIKWTGHAVSGKLPGGGLTVAPGTPAKPHARVFVRQSADAIVIRTGTAEYVVPRSGSALIRSASLGGRPTLRNGRLVALRQDGIPGETESVHTERFESLVRAASVEQDGPVRAVVRIEGMHRSSDRSSAREWLPFTVRLAIHADAAMVRIIHSFVFDGDANTDFLVGLGLSFDVPMTDEVHNRHVRFAGQGNGMFGEAVRNIPGWAGAAFKLADRFQDQLDGKFVPALAVMDAKTREQLATVPSFGDFKLFQGSSRQFTITKRRKPGLAWIKADHGGRAGGLAYVGGSSGGVALGMRDFWQLHPTALEITGAAGDAATLTAWLWSPDAGVMDMRHYSDEAHGLEIQYEDYEEGFATPTGIGRTSELYLWLQPATPARAELAELAGIVREPPLLVASPEHLHATRVFGIWGLPDRSTPVKEKLESEYDRLLSFYRHEVDQRDWYGFWDYGDVMHSYDDDRHNWRYDVGGYAWDNSEMGSDLWLWYAFLRSGDRQRFRMAEAMTRHTSEVDFYHLGRFAKLGSRHNVRHWGDSAKEPRISMAPLRRFLHYLAADERTGDLMRFVVDSDQVIAKLSPVRKIMEPGRYPAIARSGPDWYAFAGNWMTEWERTGDTQWRDRILKGLTALARMPQGLLSGPPLGYDPATAQLFDIGYHLKVYYLLTMIFGGAEVLFELDDLVDLPAWDAALVHFGETYNLPEPERVQALGPEAVNALFGYGDDKLYTTVWYARMTAFAAMKKKDAALARRAWTELLRGRGGRMTKDFFQKAERAVPPLASIEARQEIPGLTTNNAAQWSLNFVELLEMVGEHVPDSL